MHKQIDAREGDLAIYTVDTRMGIQYRLARVKKADGGYAKMLEDPAGTVMPTMPTYIMSQAKVDVDAALDAQKTAGAFITMDMLKRFLRRFATETAD